jgi:phthalate 4,5-cis-dihydrodiol dehydrogenase
VAERKLRLGVAGLGRAFSLMLPTFAADPRIALVAAADPREEATQRFAAEFGARVYASVDELCADSRVEAVYVATPRTSRWPPLTASTCWWKSRSALRCRSAGR